MAVIKAASYNIRRAIGIDGKKDLKQIQQVLGEIDADVIALQEVEMGPGVGGVSRQVHILAGLLNMNYVYGPVHRLKFGTVGNAILSKYPIINEIKHVLPDSRDERGCLQADIDAKGIPFRVFNMHLGLNQVSRYRHLKYIILPLIMASTIPAILAGDMNATPAMREMRMLSEYLHDTFEYNSGLIGYTYPSDSPRVRIDYIFTDDNCRCSSFRIINAEASDHLPVTASLKISALPLKP